MPSGSVIEYRGKRGRVFRVKYRDAEGRQVMQTLGAEGEGWTKRKAQAELRRRLARVDDGYVKPEALTFDSYAEQWFHDGPSRRGWKPNTIAEYRSVERRLREAFGTMRLEEVRPRHVAAYVSGHPYGAATVGRDLALLHAIFQTAKREELVSSNPAADAERPKLPRWRGQALKAETVQLLLRSFDDEQARTAFLTFILTGVRLSELQALRWRDVDLVENILRVADSKSKDGIRSIALPSSLAEALWQHRRATAFQGDDERVFCDPERGSRYRGETFKEALERAFATAGLEWPQGFRRCHDLRVTAITSDAIAGAGEIAVMTKAGHANMATTKRYLDLAGVVFRAEAEAQERRLLGGLSTEPSTRLPEPQRISAGRASLNDAAFVPVDA